MKYQFRKRLQLLALCFQMGTATSIITRLLDRIAGAPEETTQEHRLFNATAFTSILLIISIIVPNYFLGFHMLTNMWILAFVLSLIVYWFSRIKGMYHWAWPTFALAIYVATFFNFLDNDGIIGPTLSMSLISLVILLTTTPYRFFWMWIALHVVTGASMVVIEYSNPDWIHAQYGSRAHHLLDVGLGYVITCLIIGLILAYVRRIISDSRKQLSAQNQLLEEQRKELELSNARLTRALSVLSHDVRNPLASIEGLLEVFDSEEMDLETRKQVRQQLLKLTIATRDMATSLASWSKLQMTGHSFEPRFLTVQDLLKGTLPLIHELAHQHGIQLDLHVHEEDMLYLDSDLMSIVLRNLLHNAIKHSPADGQVMLQIQASEEKQLLIVEDWGVGMTPADVARLKEPNLKMSQLQSQDGIGLGLLLVQEFTALHQGSVDVDARPGVGTRITITIPGLPLAT